MSQADELLNSLSDDDISAYSTDYETEPHIIIGDDRRITVPDSLKRIAVESDHNVETVTFDCPRYWDEHDLSQMIIYINYKLSNGFVGSYIAENIAVEGNVLHFTWTITRTVASVKGNVIFLVCAKKTDTDGNEENHWNSELNTDMYVSEGLESELVVEEEYPDIVNQLLERMTVVEGINVNKDEMELLLSETRAFANRTYADGAAALESAKDIETNVANSASEIRNSYANAVKGTASGEIVRVDDVSPLEHDVHCLVHGKNLFDISKVTNTDLVTNNGDGTLTIAANAYYVRLAQKLSELCPSLRVDDIATFNMVTDSSYSKYIYMHGLGGTWNVGTCITITEEILNSYVCLYGYTESDPLYGQENVLSEIQIEKGTIATAYESYVDPSTVTVTRCGKNLLDVDSMCNSFLTKAGDVYTFKKGANAGDRFTNVVPVYIPAGTEICASAIFDDYTVTDGTLYMIFTYADGTQAFPGVVFKEKYKYIHLPKAVVSVQFYIQGTQEAGAYIAFRKFQLEIGATPTVYEPYTKDEISANTDGTCAVISASPNMIIYNSVSGATVKAEYNRDTTKMFESYVLTDEAKSQIVSEIEVDMAEVLASLNSYATSVISGGVS